MTMRYAIFSDIHNHSEALQAALQDAGRRSVDAYLCLGDVGIDTCINPLRAIGAETVFGNWEVSNWRALSAANQRWALALPPMRKFDSFWISHAAPIWPAKITSLQTYLNTAYRLSFHTFFPYYLGQSDSLWQAFAELLAARIPLLFHGHTHRQTVWALSPDDELTQEPATNFTLPPGYTCIIGVGSVGQPRDLPSAAYLIFDTSQMAVEFIRLRPEL